MTALADIEKVLRVYFDGLYQADPERLRRVFHPQAIYASADETPLLYRNMEEYFSAVAVREAPASRGEVRLDTIHSIELAGENTALARVGCAIGPRRFLDFLSLVRVEGAWLIMAKVFQIIQSPAEE